MEKLIALYLNLLPIGATAAVVTKAVIHRMKQKEKAVAALRAKRTADEKADMQNVGRRIMLERWRHQLCSWRNNNIKNALLAGAKRIDQLRQRAK